MVSSWFLGPALLCFQAPREVPSLTWNRFSLFVGEVLFSLIPPRFSSDLFSWQQEEAERTRVQSLVSRVSCEPRRGYWATWWAPPPSRRRGKSSVVTAQGLCPASTRVPGQPSGGRSPAPSVHASQFPLHQELPGSIVITGKRRVWRESIRYFVTSNVYPGKTLTDFVI